MKQHDLIVISSYPKKGQTHGVGTVGVASYTKNTLLAMAKTAADQEVKLNVTVLAELFNEPQIYRENGFTVKRVWQRNDLRSYLYLLREILTTHSDSILIEFEWAMFGGKLMLSLFPLFLAAVNLAGKPVTFVAHQMLTDFGQLSKHIDISKNGWKASLLSKLVVVYYRLIFPFCTKVVVFEEVLGKRLENICPSNKLVVIPHAVESVQKPISRLQARKRLGLTSNDFTVLTFGFIAWYKGTDWLIKQMVKTPNIGNKRSRLLVAGGANPNHTNKQYYQTYLNQVKKMVGGAKKNVSLTGFVPERDLSIYFSAADVVVFPYRTLMSSSGPLAIAFSYAKPFLISKPLSPLLSSPAFKQTLAKFGIMEKEVVFDMNRADLLKKMSKVCQSKILRNNLSRVAQEVASERRFELIGQTYFQLLFREQFELTEVGRPSLAIRSTAG